VSEGQIGPYPQVDERGGLIDSDLDEDRTAELGELGYYLAEEA
jgi:hypothetical protein